MADSGRTVCNRELSIFTGSKDDSGSRVVLLSDSVMEHVLDLYLAESCPQQRQGPAAYGWRSTESNL